MSDEVLIEYGDNASDTATLLLGAADELGFEPWVVRNQPEDNGFRVPEEVAQKAGLAKGSAKKTAAKKSPAKKTAKRTPAKKAAAKKTTAKKTAAKAASSETPANTPEDKG